ncbi:MAG: L-histidine N(alpha)-methyltransferase [Saprospiraceae bacterium]|nr:L-histidine N(alpha)-methyltransferase [Saprospiraceae bacterium]
MAILEQKIQPELATFANDILEGLTATPKFLPSRYFYDEKGDKLFQQIMELPEYYLTRTEFKILQENKELVLHEMDGQAFDLVELGAGDGYKTKILLRYFLSQKADFQYMPIDISANVLDALSRELHNAWPTLKVEPVEGEYFSALGKIDQLSNRKKLVLFLGSNIGNMTTARAVSFLSQLRGKLRVGDKLLIGFDRKKDPATILAAYNDAQGVTKAFNLNLLHRINKSFDADFDVSSFMHYPTYNPLTGDTKSYLVSTKSQDVQLGLLDKTIHFDAWEAIDMELSKKYDEHSMEWLAQASGFEVVSQLTDDQQYFTDAIWKAI